MIGRAYLAPSGRLEVVTPRARLHLASLVVFPEEGERWATIFFVDALDTLGSSTFPTEGSILIPWTALLVTLCIRMVPVKESSQRLLALSPVVISRFTGIMIISLNNRARKTIVPSRV